MNTIGFISAICAFLSIWFGHVAVRKIEFNSHSIWLPISVFSILGVSIEVASLVARNLTLSTVLGIIGITLFWDGFEILRQQNRIKHGHAPANPKNPRHARILKEYPSATTLDVLNRDPVGKPIYPREADKLIRESRPRIKA